MRTRFVIDVDGRTRSLFSVREVRNRHDPSMTDLNIHFSGGARSKFGQQLADLIQPGNEGEYRAAETHFSVHANPNSEVTNTITRRLTLREGGPEKEVGSVLVTTGIKSGLFVPIVFRICGDLRSPRYDIRGDDQDLIPLGALDPNRDQIRFMICIARAGQHFHFDDEHPSNLVTRNFTHYEIAVIWSYFNFPALPHAINLVPFTTVDLGAADGLEWWQVYNTYTDFNMAYANTYFTQFKVD